MRPLLMPALMICLSLAANAQPSQSSDPKPLNPQSAQSQVVLPPRSLELPQADKDINTCFTLRTYIYKHVDGGDATQLVGYRTCTPANRPQLRQSSKPGSGAKFKLLK